jgi:hypothetical protein
VEVGGNGFRKRRECRCYAKKGRFLCNEKNSRRCVDLRVAARFHGLIIVYEKKVFNKTLKSDFHFILIIFISYLIKYFSRTHVCTHFGVVSIP